MISDSHFNFGCDGKDHIHSRTELNESNALAAGHEVAHSLGENDPAGQQSRDLLEHDRADRTPHGDDVLFVFLGGNSSHRVAELATLVGNIGNYTGNGRPVHMDIKNVQKNADAGAWL